MQSKRKLYRAVFEKGDGDKMMTSNFFKALRLRSNLILHELSIKKSDTTSYLLQSPNNAARLLKGIEDYEKGLGKERSLIEE